MAYPTSFEVIHGNVVTLPVEEGAWTSDSNYKDGGYFANPVAVGDFVVLNGTVDFRVKKAASTEDPIGVVVGSPMGKNEANGRSAAIELFCHRVMKIKLSATSKAVAIGGHVCYDASNEWCKATTTTNSTMALQAIPAGGVGYIMIGVFDMTGIKDTTT